MYMTDDKIYNEIGWILEYNLIEGINETLDYYKKFI